MEHLVRKPLFGLLSGIALLLAACGGGAGSNNGVGRNTPTAPAVKVTPSANSITIADSLQVSVTVTGNSSTPTGTVKLASGSFTSSSATLTGGTAAISVPAGGLPLGSNTLAASYTPDSASSVSYTSASSSVVVAVTVATPTVAVTPASSSIGTGQPLSVAVAVTGFSGGATPTGSITLTSGNYASAATTLGNSGTATIAIPGGTFPAGSANLTASYSPDSASANIYAGASKSATITVTQDVTPGVSVSPASPSLTADQALNVTVKVNPTTGNPTPTGSVSLTAGTYQSSATTLTSGSASFTVPGYSLIHGSESLTAAYTPDSASWGTYNGGSGSGKVSVAAATPSVTVTPARTSIDTSQPLGVTVTVTGPGTGAPAATGSVRLSGSGYTNTTPAPLTSGSATINIPAGNLAAGSDTLTATYTPDPAGAAFFNAAPGTSPAITVVIFSTVTVNQATSLGPVTDQLLGMNLPSWYDVVGNASPINTAFGKAGIKAIRWPGGSWSDAYHWNAAGLPFLCNMNTTGVTAWAGYSTFSQFVTAIPQAGRYDLALTANYGSNSNCTAGGDPTEAAAWAAEALSLGNPPSHITVGNENYGSWEYDLHTRKNDPTTYANAVIGSNGYYKLITTASPATRVGVVVDANCTSADGCTNGWDSTVLSLAKGSYDFVEYHYYPQYGDITSDTYLVHQAALDFTTNINTIKSELAAVGMSGIPIYAGEIGANAGDPGTQGWSITQGLYAGQLLGEAMNDGISRLTWWIGFGNCLGSGNNSPLLYGWQNSWGAYNVFSDADPSCPGEGPIGTMNPTAQAFNLFQNIAVNGESALGTTFSGDSTNIRVYAATHSGGTALFLFNLNQNLSQPLQIKLSKTSGPVSSVQVITYDKSIYNKTNSTTPVWTPPTTTNLASPTLPLTLSLTPWSMNVVLIQ